MTITIEGEVAEQLAALTEAAGFEDDVGEYLKTEHIGPLIIAAIDEEAVQQHRERLLEVEGSQDTSDHDREHDRVTAEVRRRQETPLSESMTIEEASERLRTERHPEITPDEWQREIRRARDGRRRMLEVARDFVQSKV